MGLEYKIRMQTGPVTKSCWELSWLLPLLISLIGVGMLMLGRLSQQKFSDIYIVRLVYSGNGLYVFEQVGIERDT